MRPFRYFVPVTAILTLVLTVVVGGEALADGTSKVDVYAVLEALSPEQLDQFLPGADPRILGLGDGSSSDDLLDQRLDRAAVASAPVFRPADLQHTVKDLQHTVKYGLPGFRSLWRCP